MRRHTYVRSLILTGALLTHPTKALADGIPGPMNPDSNAVQAYTWESPTKESVDQDNRTEPFEIVAVDYCYQGSVVDPTTGEIVDLYVLCSDDEMEQEFDLT